MKVKWVRVNEGTGKDVEARYRLVAQVLGYGERLDDLSAGTSAGTPALTVVKLVLPGVTEKCLVIMLLCQVRLPLRDNASHHLHRASKAGLKAGGGHLMGIPENAM